MSGGRRRAPLRGGNFYGFSAGSATGLGTAGAEYAAVDNSKFINSETGQPRQSAGRRRASKKSKKSKKTKKSRKVTRRRRTMRGGGSVANVGYGFTGTGARGISDAVAYQANAPPTSGPFAIPTGTR